MFDGLCPWGYQEAEEDHMTLCVADRAMLGLAGFGDGDPTLDPEYVQGGGSGPTYTAPAAWNRNLTVPTFGGQAYPTKSGPPVYLSPQNPLIPAGNSWIIWAALAGVIGIVMLKGRR